MKSDKILVFCNQDLNLTITLLKNNEVDIKKDYQLSKENLPTHSSLILILPGSAGLPFKIELPFGDKAKVSKVIPQFVSDMYTNVDENWLFSWDITKSPNSETTNWIAYGLAYPPIFSPDKLFPNISCHLAIPDVFIASNIINASPETNYAIEVKTPANDIVAVYSQNNILHRIVSHNSGLPIQPILVSEGIDNIIDYNLLSDVNQLNTIITANLQKPTTSDISFWSAKQKYSLLHKVKALSVFIIVSVIAIYHLFLWLETILYEKASNRTSKAMAQAFSGTFPGQPVVEPVSQTNRAINLLKSKASKPNQIPAIHWQQFLNSINIAKQYSITINHISMRITGWSITATSPNYKNIELFKKAFLSQKLLTDINIKQTRSIATGVSFKLEGKWTL